MMSPRAALAAHLDRLMADVSAIHHSARWRQARQPRLVFRDDGSIDFAVEGANPKPLDGPAPGGLIEHLARQVYAQGYSLSIGPITGDDDVDADECYGVTRHIPRTVQISDRLSDAQTACTLTHELTHVMLHRGRFRVDGAESALPTAEFEAEAVAHLVLTACGVDSSGFTTAYIADWAAGRWPLDGGDPAIDGARVMRESRERVIDAALAILTWDGAQGVAA